ncbi:TraB/GumN family protein [uncultured Prevotella sp.]|uniref:TraB/GumN family protein n=1 Tax=uncultured Prevotella sp. TaxID=159272 RepID=UPI002631FE90|nr:TraB/GumN family protein [uncultured Prevotella sp.]
MKRILCSALLLLVAFIGTQAQLLWKISGNGLSKPSYIIGTYHLAPASFADSIPGLKNALDTSEQVYGEIIMSEMTAPENMAKLQSIMMLPEGQTIDKMFTAEEMARINAMMKDIIGIDMTNPMVAQQFEKLSPQALTMQLTVLMYLKKNPKFNLNQTFDEHFQAKAKEQGKPVGALETIDFQINLLYKGQSEERQKELLLCLADNKDMYEMQTENIIKAFFTQNLKAVNDAMDEKLNNSCDYTPQEKDELIYNRNTDWIKKMPEIMKKKSTFFAVGAGHLPGERGMLELLRQAGYKVECVK